MLSDCELPNKWWAETLTHACHLKNGNVTSVNGESTPCELMAGETPDATTVRVFGAPRTVKTPNERHKGKLADKAQPGRLHGFDWPNTQCYKLLTASGGVTHSRDVTVNEHFESKADKLMAEFEVEAGIAPTLTHTSDTATTAGTPPLTPSEHSACALAPVSEPPADEGASSAHDDAYGSDVDDRALPPHASARSKQGVHVPPVLYDPAAIRLVRSVYHGT